MQAQLQIGEPSDCTVEMPDDRMPGGTQDGSVVLLP